MSDNVEAADWRAQPDWVEHLARATAEALVASGVEDAQELLNEVEPLLASGFDEAAEWLARACLYRAVHGPAGLDLPGTERLLDGSTVRSDIEAATSGHDDDLRAASLAALGLALTQKRDYDNAGLAYSVAAEAWMAQDEVGAAALQLLRASAAVLHVEEGAAAAVQLSTRSQNLFERLGDVREATWAILNRIQAHAQLNEWDDASRLLTLAKTQARALRDGHLAASVLLEEAHLALAENDMTRARQRFMQAYRSSTRRDDLDQAFVAARNLAVLAGEQEQPTSAIRWWRIATKIADQRRDWHDEQHCRYALGMALAAEERFQEAASLLEVAARTNRQHGNELEAARITADRGAVELQHAYRSDLSDDDFDRVAARAARILLRAKRALETAGDFEWAELTIRNLRSAWTLQKLEKRGAATLIRSATQMETTSPQYADELRRNAAWLLLSSNTSADDGDRPARWIIAAATHSAADSPGRASALAQEAAVLANRGFNKTALALYDAAIRELDPASHASVYGNILNDSTLVLAELGRTTEARSRLLEVESVARNTDDRVLLGLALANLGETAIRLDDIPAARTYLRGVIELATQTGDDEAVAEALSKLANTYVDDQDEVETAVLLSAQARQAAARAGTLDARLSARSSSASAAYAVGDYEAAFELWMECADEESVEDGAEHQAFALDALAQLGDWPRYRRVLERMIRRAQAEGAQFAFVNKLHLSALSWLHQGRAAAAGKVLAYGVLLAAEAATAKFGRDGRALSTAEREREYLKIAGPMGVLRGVLVLTDLPAATRAAVRRSYERTVRSVAPDDGDELLASIENWVLGELGGEGDS